MFSGSMRDKIGKTKKKYTLTLSLVEGFRNRKDHSILIEPLEFVLIIYIRIYFLFYTFSIFTSLVILSVVTIFVGN